MITDSHIYDRAPERIEALKRSLKIAIESDQIVLCGDNIECHEYFYLLKECVWDKYPKTICVLGNHEEFYGDQNKNRKFIDENWHHDTKYISRLLKGNVLIVGMDDGQGYFNKQQIKKLSIDIKNAKKNGYTVIIFQHISFKGLREITEENLEMLDLVNSNSDVIKGVFSGHSHSDSVSFLESGIPCYTLKSNNDPEFDGVVLKIIVD